MKKLHKITLLLSAAVLGVGVAVAATINNETPFFANAEEKLYTITINENTEQFPHLQLTEDDYINRSEVEYLQFDLNTDANNPGLNFSLESAVSAPNYSFALTPGGSFYNNYVRALPNHGRINGLKKIEVNYTGGQILAAYGYEQDMDNKEYRVTSIPLTSGVAFDFGNNYPQYFHISSAMNQMTYISDITIYYTCNQHNQKFPEEPFYTSGFHVGPIDNHLGLENAFTRVAHDEVEIGEIVIEAVCRHYEFVTVIMGYNGNFNPAELMGPYRDTSYWSAILLGPSYDNTLGGENTFFILYHGDATRNYDQLYFENAPVDEHGYYTHDFVASFANEPVLVNKNEQVNIANNAIRNQYYKANNLTRKNDYNDFATEKLDDARKFDVYNSEELWWCIERNYKPNFVLKNSKAEWIYNEAKKVLRENVNDSMSDYEKVRAIYEWIVLNTKYDYDALTSGYVVFEHKCYFLEGVFERGIAVCDGFSKTFVLLCKMEGIDAIRGMGFSNVGGHAWGYVRFNENEPYYLVCPTWGDRTYNIEVDGGVKKMEIPDYNAFLSSKDFFARHGEDYAFDDKANVNVNLSSTVYPQTAAELDKIPGRTDIDYVIDTQEEFIQVINEAYRACINDSSFTIALKIDDPALKTNDVILKAVRSSNITGKGYTFTYETTGFPECEMFYLTFYKS